MLRTDCRKYDFYRMSSKQNKPFSMPDLYILKIPPSGWEKWIRRFYSYFYGWIGYNKVLVILTCVNFLRGTDATHRVIFIFIFYFLNFIYFWLHWVFVAARRGYSSLRSTGFSLRWLLLLKSTDSRHVGFSSCSTQV